MAASDQVTTRPGKPDYGQHGTDIRDLNEALRELHHVEKIALERGNNEDAFAVSVPVGRQLVSIKPLLDEYLDKPERRVGIVRAFDLASFIALVTRFATADSVVFADPDEKEPSLTAVFDYHPGNARAQAASPNLPTDWLKHRATYEPELSEEWEAWVAQDGQWMGQGDFAAFIEEHIAHLIVPHLDDPEQKLAKYAELVQGSFATPAQLIQLSRGLEISVGIKAKSAVRLQSGEISVLWEETHSDGAGQPIKVPSLFQICIPVFYAGEWYRIAARLRYRVGSGTTSWAYQLVQPELSFKSAFREMASKVANETTNPVFFGAPEA